MVPVKILELFDLFGWFMQVVRSGFAAPAEARPESSGWVLDESRTVAQTLGAFALSAFEWASGLD